MTQNPDTTTLPLPTRRRAVSAVPVLIRIPDLAAPALPRRRAHRRRLRREFRVAGYALLATLPIVLALSALSGDRLPRLSASSLTVAADPGTRIREVPAISLSLEPVGPGHRDPEAPVSLPGILLPADSTEEDAHGGH